LRTETEFRGESGGAKRSFFPRVGRPQFAWTVLRML